MIKADFLFFQDCLNRNLYRSFNYILTSSSLLFVLICLNLFADFQSIGR